MNYLVSLPRRVVTVYVPLSCFLFVLLFPFYWMTITAFKPNEELLSREGNPFWVINPTLAHFKKLLFDTALSGLAVEHDPGLGRVDVHLARSRACSRPTPSNGCASAARAYVGLSIFLAYLVPPSILFIPLATIVFKLGLFDTRLALILTYPTFLIPFCTWLLMGYFRRSRIELEECALIDGAIAAADPHARSFCRSRCRA